MMTYEEYADKVRKAVDELNEKIADAAKMGISVELETMDITGVADRCRVYHYEPKIQKTL